MIEASQLPEGEKVYMKKDLLGWRVVNPIKDPETGKIIWFNLLFGGRRGLVSLIFITLLLIFAYLGVSELISNYEEIGKNPCSFCTDCQEHTRQVLANTKFIKQTPELKLP